jgi:hypothetical protein
MSHLHACAECKKQYAIFLFQFWEGRNFQTKSTEGKKVISMNVGLTPTKELQQLIEI